MFSAVIPKRAEGANPESRAACAERTSLDSGSGASRRPGMTTEGADCIFQNSDFAAKPAAAIKGAG
jgi:hypothetical protein